MKAWKVSIGSRRGMRVRMVGQPARGHTYTPGAPRCQGCAWCEGRS